MKTLHDGHLADDRSLQQTSSGRQRWLAHAIRSAPTRPVSSFHFRHGHHQQVMRISLLRHSGRDLVLVVMWWRPVVISIAWPAKGIGSSSRWRHHSWTDDVICHWRVTKHISVVCWHKHLKCFCSSDSIETRVLFFGTLLFHFSSFHLISFLCWLFFFFESFPGGGGTGVRLFAICAGFLIFLFRRTPVSVCRISALSILLFFGQISGINK